MRSTLHRLDSLRVHRYPKPRDNKEPCPLSRIFTTTDSGQLRKRYSYLVDCEACASGKVASLFEEEFGVRPTSPLPCPVRELMVCSSLVTVVTAATRIPAAPLTEKGSGAEAESISSSSVTRSPSHTDDVEVGGDEPVASTSSAIVSYTVVDEVLHDRVVPSTSTSSVGGGAEPSTGSPLQGVNVDDVELSEIVRHLESSNPDNSTSASVYSPTGGEGNTVDEVGVDLPQLDSAVEEETLPSGLSREGIAEWIRASILTWS